MKYQNYIKDNTIRCQAGFRGGGIEIDCSGLFEYIDNPKMTAYQNYLGGGMLGAILSSSNFEEKVKSKDDKKFLKLEDELRRYFHNLTNHANDIWENASYEQNQNRPEKAY